MTASLSRNAGGLFQSVRGLARVFVDLRHSVLALGVRDHHTEADLSCWKPIPVGAYPVYGPERFSFAPGLANRLNENDPDILQLHGLWRYTSIVGSRWHRRTGKPYIVHPHGMLDPWAVRNAHWKKKLAGMLYDNALLEKAACIRALCQSEAESIRKYGCRNPVCIIPNGIDLPERGTPEINGRTSEVDGPLKEIKAVGGKVLLFLGRLHPKKGLANLVKAWASVQDLQPANAGTRPARWVLAIAGWDEGGHEQELKKLCADLGLHGSVIFMGPQFGNDKSICFQHCDAVVLPSNSEGLPMTILEAWSYAKPVVMTPECNLPEGFSARAAIKITTAVEDIGLGLRQLFDSSAKELEEMGQNGFHLAAEKFTWNSIGAQLNAVCDWIVHGATRPDCVHVD